MLIKPFSFLEQKDVVTPTPGGIVTSGLAYYYDSQNASSYPGSGTTWYDLQSSADVTLAGTVNYTTIGGVSNVFQFAGGRGRSSVVTGDAPATSGISFDCWIYIPTTISSWRHLHVFGRSPNIGTIQFIGLRAQSGQIFVNTFDNYSYSTDTNSAVFTYSNNTWYHVAGVYDVSANQLLLYVNDTVIGSPTSYTMPSTNFGSSVNKDIIIADKYTYGNQTVQYSIAQLRYYMKSLSSSEVTQNWNATKATFGY